MAIPEEPIKVGDVVLLTARRGPKLTVEALLTEGNAQVMWFDADGKLHHHALPIATIVRVDPMTRDAVAPTGGR